MLHTQGTRAWVLGVEINVHESWERRDRGTGELAGLVLGGRTGHSLDLCLQEGLLDDLS